MGKCNSGHLFRYGGLLRTFRRMSVLHVFALSARKAFLQNLHCCCVLDRLHDGCGRGYFNEFRQLVDTLTCKTAVIQKWKKNSRKKPNRIITFLDFNNSQSNYGLRCNTSIEML